MNKHKLACFLSKKRSILFILLLFLGLFLYWQNKETPLNTGSDIENPSPGEEKKITELKNFILNFLHLNYPSGTFMHRDAHVKQHGCVRANFTVDNKKLPLQLRVGVFSKNQVFPAWMRFSNASSMIQTDSATDIRGVAIKLMNVPGLKLLQNEKKAQTQDFLLVNAPVFVTDNIEHFIHLISGDKMAIISFYLTHLHILIDDGIILKKPSNPLFINYWSQTPYALGSDAVKYKMIPCAQSNNQSVDYNEPNYLKTAMAQTLGQDKACFKFLVQLQKKQMSIENASIAWDEQRAAFIPVATIVIFPQHFESKERSSFCENLSFTPWHSLPEHRPLGEINRARKIIYEAVSLLRHQRNHIKREEPVP